MGPAPDQVRSVWGLLAPAPSDSDWARPAPRSGLIAQSWVQLQPRSAVMHMSSAPFDSDLSARPAPDIHVLAG